MKDQELANQIIITIGVLIIAPIIIGAVVNIGIGIYNGVAGTINRVAYNKKIKKGIKDGSIVEVDGVYYEVVDTVEEA
jgi:hypothetical protein